MVEFTMPSLGADMDAGTLVEWRIRAGDKVQRGDIVAVVETNKGLIDIEIWQAGVVDALLVQPGMEVPVGTVLAVLQETASSPPSSAPEVAPPSAPPTPAPPPEPVSTLPAVPGKKARPAATPSARHLARELDVDLETCQGTGPHGAITRDDVTRAAAARAPGLAPPLGSVAALEPAVPPRPAPSAPGMRQAIAAAMARSKREIPHYYLALDCDLSRALAWLEGANRDRPISERLLLAALLLKATALAAREFPEMNGYHVGDAFHPSSAVHVGVAIALRQGGLVAPAIHDLDRLPLAEVMRSLGDLVKRARAGGLRSSELADSTITVTNLGDQGAHSVFGIIYPPQVALVGFGKPTQRPWADQGMLGVRSVVTVTLAADHRVSDGHAGARFLARIDQKLQEPESL